MMLLTGGNHATKKIVIVYQKRFLVLLVLVMAVAILTGCGGGSGDVDTDVDSGLESGTFIDSPVEGLL